MSAEQLALVGSRLVKRCGTRDPFEIAADIGVEVKAYFRLNFSRLTSVPKRRGFARRFKISCAFSNISSDIKAEIVLEINIDHPLAARIKELFESDKDKLATYSKILLAQARLVSGVPLDNPAEISDLVCSLML